MNVILIPTLKSSGTAIASVTAELCITILYIAFCGEYMSLRILFNCAYKKFIAGVIMSIVAFLLGLLPLNSLFRLAIQICGGGGTYILSLLFLRDKWFVNFLQGYISKINKKILNKNIME